MIYLLSFFILSLELLSSQNNLFPITLSEKEIKKINDQKEYWDQLDAFKSIIKSALRDEPLDLDYHKASYPALKNNLNFSNSHDFKTKRDILLSLSRWDKNINIDTQLFVNLLNAKSKNNFSPLLVRLLNAKNRPNLSHSSVKKQKKVTLYKKILANTLCNKKQEIFIDRYLNNYQSYAKTYYAILCQSTAGLVEEFGRYNLDICSQTLEMISKKIFESKQPITFFVNNYQNNFKAIIMDYIESAVKNY